MNIIGMLCVLLGLLFVREGRGENKKREVGREHGLFSAGHPPQVFNESSAKSNQSRGIARDFELMKKKWGRDPQLCDEFFADGDKGKCPSSHDMCCGLLNVTDPTMYKIDVYCCGGLERCCRGLCCNEKSMCCASPVASLGKQVLGLCCDTNRGCCRDYAGNPSCCQTMLGRYWWILGLLLLFFTFNKLTGAIRSYRSITPINKNKVLEEKNIQAMAYCCC